MSHMNSSSRPARDGVNDALYRSPNAVAAAFAAEQDNVITLDQLRIAGIGRGAVEHRVREQQLQRMHRAVFLMGAAPPTHRNAAWHVGRSPSRT